MKRWWMLVAVCVVMTLTACASEKTVKEVEGLSEMGEISVITREKGSGTRTVFADLTGIEREKQRERISRPDQGGCGYCEVFRRSFKKGGGD